jgi:hypothetical protein
VATVVTRRRKNLVQHKNDRIDLTPTGLLMEGNYTQNPSLMSKIGIFRQLTVLPCLRLLALTAFYALLRRFCLSPTGGQAGHALGAAR